MPFDPNVHVGVAAIIRQPFSRKILMMRRKGSHGEGTWSVPGGWIDAGETPEDALFRELEEEVGLARRNPLVGRLYLLDAVTTVFPGPINTSVTLAYRAPMGMFSGEPKIMEPEKCDKIGWISEDMMQYLDLFPPFEQLLKRQQGWFFDE